MWETGNWRCQQEVKIFYVSSYGRLKNSPELLKSEQTIVYCFVMGIELFV